MKAKRTLSLILSFVLAVTMLPAFAITSNADSDAYYLFSYFTGNAAEEQQIRFALSDDGLNFKPLNGNQAIVKAQKTSANNSSGCARDPYIQRAQDGSFYMVATDMDADGIHRSWNGDTCMYVWHSSDLVNWDMVIDWDVSSSGAFSGVAGVATVDINGSTYSMGNTIRMWAPQFIWDPSYNSNAGAYMVYWGNFFSDWNNAVLYSYTTDFENYTAPQVLFKATSGSAIDSDIMYNAGDGLYYQYYKNEDTASIRYATASNLSGPYTDAGSVLSNAEAGKALEGSNCHIVNGKLTMFIDAYASGNFVVMQSNDYKHFTYVDEEDYSVNRLNPRHASVVQITKAEYDRLVSVYGITTSSDVMYNFTNSCNIGSGWKYDYYYDSNGKTMDLMLGNSGSTAYVNKGAGYITLKETTMFCNDGDVKDMFPDDIYSVSFYYTREDDTVHGTPVFALGTGSGAPSANTDYVMLFDNGDFWVRKSGESSDTQVGTTSIALGVTYRFDIVSDGTNITLYKDGKEVCTIAATVDFPSTGTRYAAFGFTDGHSSAGYGSGTYSKIRFRDRALSSSEVLTEFNSGLTLYSYTSGSSTLDGKEDAADVSSMTKEAFTGVNSSSYSIAGWVNPGDFVSSYSGLISIGSDSSEPYPYGRFFTITEGGEIHYDFCNGATDTEGGATVYAYSQHYYDNDSSNAFGSALTANTWYYLQLNFIPYANNRVKLIVYINGVQTSSTDISLSSRDKSNNVVSANNYYYNPLSSFAQSTNYFSLGGLETPSAYYGDGSAYVKDIKFYSQALDPAVLYRSETKAYNDPADDYLIGQFFSTSNVWYDAVTGNTSGIQWQSGNSPTYDSSTGYTRFDTTYVRIANENMFEDVNANTGLTITYSYKTNGTDNHRHLLSLGSGNASTTNNHFYISSNPAWYKNGMAPLIEYIDSGANAHIEGYPDGAPELAANTEYNVAIVITKTSLTYYINGIRYNMGTVKNDAESSLTEILNNISTYTNNYIGRSRWNDPNFDGYIKDLCFYKKALSEEQLTYKDVSAADARTYVEAHYGELDDIQSFNAVAYHEGNPAHKTDGQGNILSEGKGYSNVVYCTTTTSWSGSNGYNNSYTSIGSQNVKIAMPTNIVFAYDGVNDICGPAIFEHTRNGNHNTNTKWVGADDSDWEFRQYWLGYYDSNNQNYTMWPGVDKTSTSNCNSYFGYSSDTYQENVTSSITASRFYWNKLYFKGSPDTTNYYTKTYRQTFTMVGWQNNVGDSGNKTGTIYSNNTQYVINYKPIRDIAAGTKKIPNTRSTAYDYYVNYVRGNEWTFTDESLDQYFIAMYLVLRGNPNLYTYANTSTDVVQCANSIKYGLAAFDEIELVKKELTMTFTSTDGYDTEATVIAGNTLNGVIPANTATRHIPSSDTHRVYSWASPVSASYVPHSDETFTETYTTQSCTIDNVDHPDNGDINGYTIDQCTVCEFEKEATKVYHSTDWSYYTAAVENASTILTLTQAYTPESLADFASDILSVTEDVTVNDQTKSQAYIDRKISSILEYSNDVDDPVHAGDLDMIDYSYAVNVYVNGTKDDEASVAATTYSYNRVDGKAYEVTPTTLTPQYTGDGTVYKWEITHGATTHTVNTQSKSMNVALCQNSVYNIYVTTDDAEAPDDGKEYSQVTVYSKAGKIADIGFVENGTYTVGFDGSVITFGETATMNVHTSSMYTANSITINGVTISRGSTGEVTLDGDTFVGVAYSPASGKNIVIHFGDGSYKKGNTSTMNQDYSSIWDEKLTVTADGTDANTLWKLRGVPFAYGSDFTFRVTQNGTITKESTSGQEAIAEINYLDYSDMTFTIVANYYVPDGATLDEAGLKYKVDTKNATFPSETVTYSNVCTGGTARNLTANLTDTNQVKYLITRNKNTAVAFGVVAYVKYTIGETQYTTYSDDIYTLAHSPS